MECNTEEKKCELTEFFANAYGNMIERVKLTVEFFLCFHIQYRIVDIEIVYIEKCLFLFIKASVHWEPCGSECGPGKPECPKFEKCQTAKEHEGSPLLCSGKCEKIPAF